MTGFLDQALPGFLTGLSLIVAIGAQNAYLLRVGISAPKRVVFAASAICALSDFALIAAGVGGLGVVVERFPRAIAAVTVFGVVFLVAYGLAPCAASRPPKACKPGRTGPTAGIACPASSPRCWPSPG